LELQRAIWLLRVRYGRRWRRHAPADLVWMLRAGVSVDEVCERIRTLVGIEDATKIVDGPSSRSGSPAAAGVEEKRPVRNSPDPVSDHGEEVPGWSVTVDVRRDRFVEAMRLNRQHWIEVGRPISAETLRQRLHLSADASRELTRALRAADRAVVIAAGVPNVTDGPIPEEVG
jgi:hypothetical protein